MAGDCYNRFGTLGSVRTCNVTGVLIDSVKYWLGVELSEFAEFQLRDCFGSVVWTSGARSANWLRTAKLE
jgi:hypothetical protein